MEIFTKCHGRETRSSRTRSVKIFKARKHQIFSPVLTTPQLSTHLGPSSNPSQTSNFTIKWSQVCQSNNFHINILRSFGKSESFVPASMLHFIINQSHVFFFFFLKIYILNQSDYFTRKIKYVWHCNFLCVQTVIGENNINYKVK